MRDRQGWLFSPSASAAVREQEKTARRGPGAPSGEGFAVSSNCGCRAAPRSLSESCSRAPCSSSRIACRRQGQGRRCSSGSSRQGPPGSSSMSGSRPSKAYRSCCCIPRKNLRASGSRNRQNRRSDTRHPSCRRQLASRPSSLPDRATDDNRSPRLQCLRSRRLQSPLSGPGSLSNSSLVSSPSSFRLERLSATAPNPRCTTGRRVLLRCC